MSAIEYTDDRYKRLPFYKRWTVGALDYISDGMFTKRQMIPVYVNKPNAVPRYPEVSIAELSTLSRNNWLLRMIFRALTNEIISTRPTIEPKFKVKCVKCGKEFNTPQPERCDVCNGKEFKKPNYRQYTAFNELIKHPNDDERNFTELLRSTLWYNFSVDDWYWEILYEYLKSRKTPQGFRVLDSVGISPIQDAYGKLGNNEYFCPMCYEQTQLNERYDDYVIIDPRRQRPESVRCKKCNSPMVQSAYKQIVNAKVVSRWCKDEVIHGSSTRIDPRPFGMQKVLACLKHIYIIDFMDEYNLQVYSHGEVSSILIIPGADDSVVKKITTEIAVQRETQEKLDVQTGKFVNNLELFTAIVGADISKGAPTRIPLMEPLNALQSLAFYQLYVEKVCSVFGVIPLFSGETSGVGGQGRDQIQVKILVPNSTTNAYMADFEEPFNNQLLPIFGITDWVLKFPKLESRDALREAQIRLTNIQAVSLATRAGFEVDVKDDLSNFTISPKPVKPPKEKGTGDGSIPRDLTEGAPARTMGVGIGDGVSIQEPKEQGTGDDED